MPKSGQNVHEQREEDGIHLDWSFYFLNKANLIPCKLTMKFCQIQTSDSIG